MQGSAVVTSSILWHCKKKRLGEFEVCWHSEGKTQREIESSGLKSYVCSSIPWWCFHFFSNFIAEIALIPLEKWASTVFIRWLLAPVWVEMRRSRRRSRLKSAFSQQCVFSVMPTSASCLACLQGIVESARQEALAMVFDAVSYGLWTLVSLAFTSWQVKSGAIDDFVRDGDGPRSWTFAGTIDL